jgi:hypothetical protein
MISLTQNIFLKWLVWHFFEVPKSIIIAIGNFLRFNINYFSIPLLLQTFFSHWRRYKESYGRGFDPTRYFQVFVGNMISRIFGAIFRTGAIFISIFFEFSIFVAGILIFIIWLILPLILLVGIYFGYNLIF